MQIAYIGLAVAAFLFLLSLLAAPSLLRPTPEAARILEVVRSNRPDQRRVGGKEQLHEGILSAAKALRAQLGMSENTKLKQRLFNAGLREKGFYDLFFAMQCLFPLLLAFAASFIGGENGLFWIFTGLVLGYMAPDFWLTWKTKKRKSAIRRSMPDAMDLLVICVDAGLGLDQALLRVGQELELSHKEIAEEFTQVHLEQRAGKMRLEAWQALAARTQIDEFAGFVSMLVQSDRFGTPIAKALSRFSEELRQKRRQHAEEQAAKTKIKIVFPLVLFIFPCIFIVLLAPALLAISKGIGTMTPN
jgi:tight adherence protein C